MLKFIKQLNDKYNNSGELSPELFSQILSELVEENPEISEEELEKLVKDWYAFEKPEIVPQEELVEEDSKGVKVTLTQLEKNPQKVAKAAEKVDIELVNENKKVKKLIDKKSSLLAKALVKEWVSKSNLKVSDKKAKLKENSGENYTELESGLYYVTADWKDTDSLISGFIEVLKDIGYNVKFDPEAEGTDEITYLISKYPITKKTIKKYAFSENKEPKDSFLRKTKLLKENKQFIVENIKQAKQYVASGKLSEEDLKMLIDIDPSSTRKYVGWMAKQWISKSIDNKDKLRNTIEEYNVFLEKGKAKTKDINKFKTFDELFKEIDTINNTGEGISVKELESDYETIIKNKDLLIMSPHTHEASRKLGLTHFSYRDCGDGKKDSSWCTTYKAPDHFNDYYYNNNVTFYYVKVLSEDLKEKLEEAFSQNWQSMVVTALAVLDSGEIDGYDGNDTQLSANEIKKFTEIIGIS